MAKDTRVGWFRRWMAAFYASLLAGSAMSKVDWSGWRVD